MDDQGAETAARWLAARGAPGAGVTRRREAVHGSAGRGGPGAGPTAHGSTDNGPTRHGRTQAWGRPAPSHRARDSHRCTRLHEVASGDGRSPPLGDARTALVSAPAMPRPGSARTVTGVVVSTVGVASPEGWQVSVRLWPLGERGGWLWVWTAGGGAVFGGVPVVWSGVGGRCGAGDSVGCRWMAGWRCLGRGWWSCGVSDRCCWRIVEVLVTNGVLVERRVVVVVGIVGGRWC